MMKREKNAISIRCYLFAGAHAHCMGTQKKKNRSKSHGSTVRKYVFDTYAKWWFSFGDAVWREHQIQSERERKENSRNSFALWNVFVGTCTCTFPFGDFVLPRRRRRRFSSHRAPSIRGWEMKRRRKNELKIRPKLLILGFRCRRCDSWSIVTLFCMFNFAAVARTIFFLLHYFHLRSVRHHFDCVHRDYSLLLFFSISFKKQLEQW